MENPFKTCSVNHLSCFVDASALEEGKILVSVDVTRQDRIAFSLNIWLLVSSASFETFNRGVRPVQSSLTFLVYVYMFLCDCLMTEGRGGS